MRGIDKQDSESVKCRFSKCRFSVLNLKFDFISDGGCTREKQIQKALGSLPPCGNRCRFSESAICSSRVRPPSEIKSNLKFKTLRWRPLRWRLTLSQRQTMDRLSFPVAHWGGNSLRAKGALISEPRFSTPCKMRFSHARKGIPGKRPAQRKKPSTKAIFPWSRGKNRISQGVENRGSLISVPLALRVITH